MGALPSDLPVVIPVIVSVGQDGYPTVNKDAFELWSNRGDSIMWSPSPKDLEFHVCFETDTPFLSRHFHSSSGHSGPVKPSATGRYKYCIEINGKILDPTVIVRP
jgi:hypothetical protein